MQNNIINFINNNFLTFYTNDLIQYFENKEISDSIDIIKATLNTEGITDIRCVYKHPVNQSYYVFEHQITLYDEDFINMNNEKSNYFSSIIFEMELILNELFERPCLTTCDKCQLKKCTRGILIANKF